MSRQLQIGLAVVGALFGSLCITLAIVATFSAPIPHPVGADGQTTGTTIPWSMVISAVLTLLGSSSFLAPYIAFFTKAKTIVEPILNTVPVPVQPVVNPTNNLPADTIEVLEAVRAFVSNPKDIKAQRRFVVAVTTEFADLAVFQSPEVAAALAALGQAVVKEWFPVAGAAK